MWAMSESEISVPMESSAAALMTASRSSGRMVAKSVVAAFVRKPVWLWGMEWVYFRGIWLLTH
jgi:hypothetical protein